MNVIDKDWRMHPGQKVVIDIRPTVYEILNVSQKDKAYDISLVEGYYLPGDLQPTILDNKTYYFHNESGERCLFVKPFKGIGDIYDGATRTVVLSEEKALLLRRTPSDNIYLSSMILDYVDHIIRTHSRHTSHRNFVGGREGIIVSLTEYRLDDIYSDSIDTNVVEIAESIDEILEKRIEGVIEDIARANPFMIFITSIKSGALYIEALIDYRVSEWERGQLNRQIEKELEEDRA